MATIVQPKHSTRSAASRGDLRRRIEIFLAHGPAYHIVYGQWRVRRWLGSLAPAAALDERQFLQCFDLERPELAPTREALVQGDSAAAAGRLSEYFRVRSQPAWFFTPEEAPSIAAQVPLDLKSATCQRADDICQNIFQFRRAEPVAFQTGIDWRYRPVGNTDWNWDLNRHYFFQTLGRAYLYTGEERYARKFQELLLDWLAHNPPGTRQPAWSSVFEVSFRINTWLWAFYFFRRSPSLDTAACRALLEGLWRHGMILSRHIELHAANNHLLLEAKSLAMLGLVFPEFRQAARWRRRGLELLHQEIRNQVLSDGVHTERVSHYQQAIGGELLELSIWCGNNQQPIPPDIAMALSRMVEYQVWATKPNGHMPLLGDSGLEDSHSQYSAAAAGPLWLGRSDLYRREQQLAEMDYWLLGNSKLEQRLRPLPEANLPSRAFTRGGYILMRQGVGPNSPYLIFDAAPFGYEPVPGHGHADALCIELHTNGQTWLIDPGVYGTWAPAEWRNFFRGTRAHNTVVVDDQDQSVLVDTRRVYRPAAVRLHRWLTDNRLDLADASHDGYQRLPAPITHRRQVLFVKPDYWVVFDQLTGQGEHQFDLIYHFHPDQEVALDDCSGAAYAGRQSGPGLSVVPLSPAPWQAELITGSLDPIQGWAALYSGEKRPAPVLRYRRTGAAPAEFCTVLYPTSSRAPSIQVRFLPVEPGPGTDAWPAGQVTGLTIETDQASDLIVLDRGEMAVPKAFAGYTSQANLVVIRRRLRSGEVLRLDR